MKEAARRLRAVKQAERIGQLDTESCTLYKYDWSSGACVWCCKENCLPRKTLHELQACHTSPTSQHMCSVLPRKATTMRAPAAGTTCEARHLYNQTFSTLILYFVEAWSLDFSTTFFPLPPNPAPPIQHPDYLIRRDFNTVDGPWLVVVRSCHYRRRVPLPSPQNQQLFFRLYCSSPSSSLDSDGLVLFRPQQHGACPAPAFCQCHN